MRGWLRFERPLLLDETRQHGAGAVSSRTCPDWPALLEVAPDLQFKHYTVAEARLPAEALGEPPRRLA